MNRDKGISTNNNRMNVTVPDRLTSHPLVEMIQQLFKEQKPDRDGLLIPPTGGGYLDVRASRECLGRALCIADTLLKEAGRQGYQITTDTQEGTTITVDGEPLEFKIGEKLKRVPAKQSYRAKMGGYCHDDSTGLIPSGVMRITVSGSWLRSTKVWEDGPRKGKIEEQLATILEELRSFAGAVRQRRIEYEEQRRQREAEQEERRKLKEAEEQERQRLETLRRKEDARRTQLRHDAQLWGECHRIRSYLNAVEQTAREQCKITEPDSEFVRWITWAQGYVDSIDPLQDLERYQLDV